MKLSKLIIELIDIYNPEDLESKDIKYDIEQESSKRFRVNLQYKDQYYAIIILPIYNPKRPSINFGSTDINYQNMNMSNLINSKYSSRILAAIFGLVRYWVEKYNIEEFEYVAEGRTRNRLYDYYLEKHFSDFKKYQEKYGENVVQVWKKT